jgi:hypothetical protein
MKLARAAADDNAGFVHRFARDNDTERFASKGNEIADPLEKLLAECFGLRVPMI